MIVQFKNWCLYIWTGVTKKKTGNSGEILVSDKTGKYIWKKP